MADVVAIIVKGGIVMIPLLACSLVSLALTIERLIFWRRLSSGQAPRNMLELVEAGEFDNGDRSVPMTSTDEIEPNFENPAPFALLGSKGRGDRHMAPGSDVGRHVPPRVLRALRNGKPR